MTEVIPSGCVSFLFLNSYNIIHLQTQKSVAKEFPYFVTYFSACSFNGKNYEASNLSPIWQG